MSVSFNGIGENNITFICDDTVQSGCPVKMSGNGTVTKCADGDRFIGIAVHADADLCAAVQTKGFVRVAYSGAAPAVGVVKLVADGNGGVKANGADAGAEYLAVEVDTVNSCVGIIM